MKAGQLRESMSSLRLTLTDIGIFMEVKERTVHRWLSGESAVPGSVARAIEAWTYLENLGMPWRPDGIPLSQLSPDSETELPHNRKLQEQIQTTLEKVTKRGGTAAPWVVDLRRRCAELQGSWVKFYPLKNGSFSLQTYGRKDKPPDLIRDHQLLEDAIACIASTISNEHRKLKNSNWLSVKL
jgi:hypothetical protein